MSLILQSWTKALQRVAMWLEAHRTGWHVTSARQYPQRTNRHRAGAPNSAWRVHESSPLGENARCVHADAKILNPALGGLIVIYFFLSLIFIVRLSLCCDYFWENFHCSISSGGRMLMARDSQGSICCLHDAEKVLCIMHLVPYKFSFTLQCNGVSDCCGLIWTFAFTRAQ